ncbi:hypothetical protein P3X46_010444 [Hevea brasiliensis]|uniref:Myb-like domain-containing protein n=1 Tax=Hevea brasiliensis TaxID=3981 RepID=A0ABQ9MI82_HEVBR|nr:hypothetical protein P3X46_010444 [Hevea brasiliensis]
MSSHWHCEQKEKIECERAREKEQRSSGIMGNQKQKWTVEEEALLNGVAKHGPGKWKNILKDPDFAPFLTQRSNIDLKCELMLEERYRQREQMLEERMQHMMQSIMAQMMQVSSIRGNSTVVRVCKFST